MPGGEGRQAVTSEELKTQIRAAVYVEFDEGKVYTAKQLEERVLRIVLRVLRRVGVNLL